MLSIIPFHERHPLEPLLIAAAMSLVLLLAAFTLLTQARIRHEEGRPGWRLRLAAGPFVGLSTYLCTMALVTNWVSKPYGAVLLSDDALPYLALGTALGTAFAFAPGRMWRVVAGAGLYAAPVVSLTLETLHAQPHVFTAPVTLGVAALVAKAAAMGAVASWLATSASHVTRAGAALFATSALTMTLSAAPAVMGTEQTVWTVSAGTITPWAAWAATAMVFVLICTAVWEHRRLGRAERTRREMQRSQDRLHGFVQASFEGLVVHRDGLIVDSNDRFRAMACWKPLYDVPPAPLSHLVENADRLQVDGAPHETRLMRRDGAPLPVEVLSQPLDPDAPSSEARLIVTAVRDLSQRKAQDRAIRHLARHDGLTDLLNRTAFNDAVAERLARPRAEGALVLLDLDRFKPVNDTHGHPAGDRVLQVLAKRFRAVLRPDDLLARFGGDEFAVFVHRVEGAADAAERLIRAAAEPIVLDGEGEREGGRNGNGNGAIRVAVGASAGVAVCPRDAATGEALTGHADAALYRAKNEGRGCVRLYDRSLRRDAEERRRMTDALRRAAEAARNDTRHVSQGDPKVGEAGADGLAVAFQPVFAAASGETVALEALVRWRTAEWGEVEPEAFLPLAEEAGLCAAIGGFVLREACRAGRDTGLRVCVNVSASQLALSVFAREVEDVLDETGLPFDRLELEVSETVLLRDAALLDALVPLAERGVGVALDDVGTGATALGALAAPFGRIKIDGGFVRALAPERRLPVLEALVRLARANGLQVTAEGVESHEELALATRAGADAVQGFLLARPDRLDRLPAALDTAA